MQNRLRKLNKNELGQALVIVLCLLAAGGVVIAPLLNYMHTRLSADKVYWERAPLSYSAEAGMEDALWKADNDEVPLEPYDYVSEYTYSLPENINNNEVQVNIKQVWPLDGLESDENGTVPATGLYITGGVVSSEGRYEVRLGYDTPETELLIDKVGVWLPPGFEYVADSASVITDENPVQTEWNGGTILIWTFPNVDF